MHEDPESFRDEDGYGVLSEINITPFVDVMLVLLVIFMVTAPFLQQGIDIDLPAAKTPEIKMESDPIILTVKEDGEIYIDKYTISLEDIPEKLAQIMKAKGSEEVFLRADRDVRYGLVVQVMAETKRAGATRLGMITAPVKEEEEGR